jgi:hypothetical protein
MDLQTQRANTVTAPLMTAGACFMEPQEGTLRLVIGAVYSALDDQPRAGFVVQEYVPQCDADGFELVGCEWADQCPLTDAHFILPLTAPAHWMAASKRLRDVIERGEPVTLDVERAALAASRTTTQEQNGVN